MGINSPLSVKTAFSGPVSGFAVDDVPVVNGVTVNSPVIHEAAKEPGMRYGLVPGQIRCTVAMVETHHRVSSPVMLDLLPGVPEQDHAARLTTRNLNRADEPIVPEGIVRLADGTGAGEQFRIVAAHGAVARPHGSKRRRNGQGRACRAVRSH